MVAPFIIGPKGTLVNGVPVVVPQVSPKTQRRLSTHTNPFAILAAQQHAAEDARRAAAAAQLGAFAEEVEEQEDSTEDSRQQATNGNPFE